MGGPATITATTRSCCMTAHTETIPVRGRRPVKSISIQRELWVPLLQETEVLLVGGGDCQYLSYWMRQSGLADLPPTLLDRMV